MDKYSATLKKHAGDKCSSLYWNSFSKDDRKFNNSGTMCLCYIFLSYKFIFLKISWSVKFFHSSLIFVGKTN